MKIVHKIGAIINRNTRADSGVAVIELLLLLPLFGVILSGLITLGDAFEQRKLISEAMRHGARGAAATAYPQVQCTNYETDLSPASTLIRQTDCGTLLGTAVPPATVLNSPDNLAEYLYCGHLVASGSKLEPGWKVVGDVVPNFSHFESMGSANAVTKHLVALRVWRDPLATQNRPFSWSTILNRAMGNTTMRTAFVLEKCQ